MPSLFQKSIYVFETLLVAVPSVFFLLIASTGLFPSMSLATLGLSVGLLCLWGAGWIGVFALFQMLIPIFSGTATEIRLLKAKLSVGIVSSLSPILFTYMVSGRNEIPADFFIFLCPVFVGIHWFSVLNALNRKAQKTSSKSLSNSSSHIDPQTGRRTLL